MWLFIELAFYRNSYNLFIFPNMHLDPVTSEAAVI